MAMTSCNVTLFIPLLSAPLIKVESNIDLDIAAFPIVTGEVLAVQYRFSSTNLNLVQEAPPPDQTPLLI